MTDIAQLLAELQSLPAQITRAMAEAEARGEAAGRAAAEASHEQVIAEIAQALDAIRHALPPAAQSAS